MPNDARLSGFDIARYSAPVVAIAFAGIPLYIYAPDYYATEHGVSLSTLGIVLLLLRLVDAVQDPLIGQVSDRRARYRLPVMLAAALGLVAGFTALFSAPAGAGAVWFALSMVVATTSYSVLSINLNSMGGLWSADSYQKTRITMMREALGLLGLLIAVLLPALLLQSMEAAAAFGIVSAVLALLMLVGFALFVPWYRRHQAYFTFKDAVPLGFAASMHHIPRATRRFLLVYGLSMLSSAIPAVLIVFFVRDRLEAEALLGLFLAVYFVAGAAAMPLWQYVSKRMGKIQAWKTAMLLAVMSFAGAFFLGAGDVVPFVIICVLSGMAFGAELALPPSILADRVQQHAQQASSGLQFSLMAFLLKASVAVATGAAFILLDGAGLQPAKANSAGALWWLSATYALIPCMIKLGAVALLWRSAALFSTGGSDDKKYVSDRSAAHAR